jgi:hypothetical protein
MRERVRVILRQAVPAVTKALLANLLWDAQRVHCRSVRVPAVKPQRGRTLLAPRCLFNGFVSLNDLRKQLWVYLRNLQLDVQ